MSIDNLGNSSVDKYVLYRCQDINGYRTSKSLELVSNKEVIGRFRELETMTR